MKVLIRCEAGHEQTIAFAMDREWVEQWCGIVDGTSPVYIHSPVDTDSIIGKCCYPECRKQIKATIVEE